MTLESQLRNWLQENDKWVPKGVLTADLVWKHKKGKSLGARYLPETVGRALRLLEEQSIVAVRSKGISVEYHFIPIEWRSKYIPSSRRERGKEDVLWSK